MAAWGTCTYPEIATPKRVEGSRSCGSSTNETPKTRWTPWTARSSTGASCESRWPATADPQTPTTAEDGEEEEEEGEAPPGGPAAAAGAGAPPPARDNDDAAGPAAGADLVPGAGPAIASPGLGPIPDPSLLLPRARKTRPSPSLFPDLDLDPDPGPEVAPLLLKEGPGQDLKVSPSRRQKMEADPRRAQRIGNR